MPRREPPQEPDPYRKERLEIRRLLESDQKVGIEHFASLRRRIEDDIERERRSAHAILAKQLVQASPRRVNQLVKDFVEKWIDIPARLYLTENEDPEPYVKLLDEYLVKREDPIWDVLAPAVGGDETLRVIISGRISHWKAKAMELARNAVDRKSSPKGLIDGFMERARISSYDGRDGFTERLPAVGRDTLFAVRDESRWVKKETYVKIAHFIGCRPEQLHPRGILPPRRRPKH
ncbi:MAG TPA: hypothetical protein VFF58_00385 [Candidatus Nitrosotalea sp.]|nr:hypothetical protein [Candidatus Nitrosotalea sp.]